MKREVCLSLDYIAKMARATIEKRVVVVPLINRVFIEYEESGDSV
jgi:hypothetical protein